MNANELADAIEKGGKDGFFQDEMVAMLRQQQEEIEYWKEMFEKSMKTQEIKPAKYSDAWWKEVDEFNKQLRAQKND